MSWSFALPVTDVGEVAGLKDTLPGCAEDQVPQRDAAFDAACDLVKHVGSPKVQITAYGHAHTEATGGQDQISITIYGREDLPGDPVATEAAGEAPEGTDADQGGTGD